MAPKSWTSTLRLPSSAFGARATDGQVDRLLKACTEDLYRSQRTALDRRDQKTFALHDGPPYANGSLHTGHALNKILKDMILRVRLQHGEKIIYRPGWDCHGLPIELKALEAYEKKHGVKANRRPETSGTTTKQAPNLSPKETRLIARELASEAIQEQMAGFKSYGVMCDWDEIWRTNDSRYVLRQLQLFKKLHERGLIYRKYKPVYWSPSSRTALAEAELEYREDHVSHTAYVRFPIKRDANFDEILRMKGFAGTIFALIWTTTPWTLPANMAIAVHDELEYCVVKLGSDALLLAKQRLSAPEIAGLFPSEPEVLVDSIKGSDLKGLRYQNKLRGRSAPALEIIHAPFVSPDSGTGLVHLAPGHGHEDYDVCSALGMEAMAPITDDGHFTEEAYPDDPEKLTKAGSILKDGSRAVIALLGDDVLGMRRHRHKYPYDWRTKEPVVVRATAQWFCDVDSIKEDALEALKQVHFIPESGRNRLESFVKGRSEWCISRQRVWGVPIPALFDAQGNTVMTSESVAHIVSVIKKEGVEGWFNDDPTDPKWWPQHLPGTYTRGVDTMDVWFDSGSSWQELKGQADVYLEGTDQHRGWFQSSLLTWVAALEPHEKRVAPFKTLITHGFTLDAKGKKMSKSLGNVITPEQMMGVMSGALSPSRLKSSSKTPTNASPTKPLQMNLGPDGLRLWVASSDYTKDIIVSPQSVDFAATTLRKYRTIIKMLLGSLHQEAQHTPLTKLDCVALVQASAVEKEAQAAFDSFEFFRATAAINRWVVNDLSAFYLEALKDRLYCGDGGGAIPYILHTLLRMLAPVTPVLVQEAWEHMPAWAKRDREYGHHPATGRASDIRLDESPTPLDMSQVPEDIPALMAAHSAVKHALEQARKDKKIGSSLQSHVVITIESDEALRRYEDELATMFVVSGCELNGNLPGAGEGAFHYVKEFEVSGRVATAHVLPPKDAKCPRCWRYLAPKEDELCGRCDEIAATTAPDAGHLGEQVEAPG